MISVVACTKRPGFVGNIIENFQRQSFEKKELVLILNRNDADENRVDSLLQKQNIQYQLFQLDETVSLGECLNVGIKKATYDVIAKFDDDDYYSAAYLMESFTMLNEKGADIVGKAAFFIYLKAYKELRLYHGKFGNRWIVPEGHHYPSTNFLSGATLVFKKQVIERNPFPNVNRGEDSFFQKACLDDGWKIYASSAFNYVYIRYKSSAHHSSDSPDYLLRKRSQKIAKTTDFRSFILSP